MQNITHQRVPRHPITHSNQRNVNNKLIQQNNCHPIKWTTASQTTIRNQLIQISPNENALILTVAARNSMSYINMQDGAPGGRTRANVMQYVDNCTFVVNRWCSIMRVRNCLVTRIGTCSRNCMGFGFRGIGFMHLISW